MLPSKDLYAPSADGAQAKWDALSNAVDSPSWRHEGATLFVDVVTGWLKVKAPDAMDRIDRPVRGSTFERDYELRLRKHAVPYLGSGSIEDIDGRTLKAWMRWLACHDRSYDTIRRTLARVKQVLRWAHAEGFIAGDCFWETVQGPIGNVGRRRGVVTDTDLGEIGAIRHAIEGHYLGVMYEIGLMLGPRPGELRGLTSENVDRERRLIHLHYTLDWVSGGRPLLEDTKTEAAFRTIRLPDSLWSKFEAYLDAHDRTPVPVIRKGAWVEVDLVFRRRNGEPLRGDGAGGTNDLFKRALRRAGLVPTAMYNLRHLAVALLLTICEPREVAQIVGHSSYRLTLDTYTPRMRELLDRTAIDLEPLYRHLTEIGYAKADKVSDKVSDPAEAA